MITKEAKDKRDCYLLANVNAFIENAVGGEERPIQKTASDRRDQYLAANINALNRTLEKTAVDPEKKTEVHNISGDKPQVYDEWVDGDTHKVDLRKPSDKSMYERMWERYINPQKVQQIQDATASTAAKDIFPRITNTAQFLNEGQVRTPQERALALGYNTPPTREELYNHQGSYDENNKLWDDYWDINSYKPISEAELQEGLGEMQLPERAGILQGSSLDPEVLRARKRRAGDLINKYVPGAKDALSQGYSGLYNYLNKDRLGNIVGDVSSEAQKRVLPTMKTQAAINMDRSIGGNPEAELKQDALKARTNIAGATPAVQDAIKGVRNEADKTLLNPTETGKAVKSLKDWWSKVK